MAVIHISESESASLSPILEKIRAGNSVVIRSGGDDFSLVRLGVPRRTLSEVIRLAEQRNSTLTLDDQFGDDLEAVIRQHQNESPFDPWA